MSGSQMKRGFGRTVTYNPVHKCESLEGRSSISSALSFNIRRLMGDMGVVNFAHLMSMFKAPVS